MHHQKIRGVLLTAAFSSCSIFSTAAVYSQEAPKPTAEMQAVLDKITELEIKPFHTIDVPTARTQATAADAARAVQREKRIAPDPEAQVKTQDISIPSQNGNLPARVYFPEGEGPFPVVVYYHGGGWVVADVNVYDSAPRSLALGVGAIVVSADYRHGPEYKFPAAHEDAWTAYAWTVENIHTLNGDAGRIAVAGESAGGNLAANVALMAKEMQATLPVHQVLVYPLASNDPNTPSKTAFPTATPLGAKDIDWFVSHVFASKDETADTRINLVARTDLGGLPPATVIIAEIDPLQSESQMYADKLKEAGVAVEVMTYAGVTHEFFGMGKVVAEANAANDLVNKNLKAAFDAAPKAGAAQ